VLVEVGPLRVLASGDGPPPAGTPVTISVRPEHVKLGAAASGAANRWDGRLQDVTFMGSVVRARVAIDGGIVLTAEVQNDAAAGLSPGMPVAAGWFPQHTIVLVR